MYHTPYNKTNLTSCKPDPILSTSSKFSWLVFGLNYIYCTTCLYHFEQSNYIKTVYLMFHQIPKANLRQIGKFKALVVVEKYLIVLIYWTETLLVGIPWVCLNRLLLHRWIYFNYRSVKIDDFYTGLTMINSRGTS